MSLVRPSHITPHSCIYSSKQQLEHTYAFNVVGAEPTRPIRDWAALPLGKAWSQQAIHGAHCQGNDRFLHFDRVPRRNVKLAFPRRLSGNLPARCRLVRHYSSPARAESAPLLPVFSDTPSYCPREKVKRRSPLSKKIRRDRPPRGVLMQTPNTGDTSNKESLANSRVDSMEHARTSSTALEYDPPPILPKIHGDTSQSAVTESSVHHGRYSLSQRLLHLYVSFPHVSIQSLVSYHNTFPDQQSSRSYNLLLRLAIRHSAFGIARALIKSMRVSRVPEDPTTWKLCVRLLVREGRWSDAYNLVYNLPKSLSRTPLISDGIPTSVWVELLGTMKRRAFRGLGRLRDRGMCSLARYRHVMRRLPKPEVSSMDAPPPEVVYGSVAALIRMQEREAARQLTVRFLPSDPKGLGLRLLHLHVAPEPGKCSMKTYYRAIGDLQSFRELCPKLAPNSTTLYLLLGHLKRVKACGIIGHKLARWFRRRWGNSVISPGVERRLLALAVKEKRVGLIKEWMTCVKTRRKVWSMWSLEREVVDGAVRRQRSVTRDPEARLGKAGTEELYVNRLLGRASRVLKREAKAID
jgi:hypothetical protein